MRIWYTLSWSDYAWILYRDLVFFSEPLVIPKISLCKDQIIFFVYSPALNLSKILVVVKLLCEYGELPQTYRPHKLTGNRQGQWECHIQPDWLMVWEQNDTELTLLFIQTGTHSDLF